MGFGGNVARFLPAAQGSANRHSRQSAAAGNRRITQFPIPVDARACCRCAAGINRPGHFAGLVNQPETVTGKTVHVRIKYRYRGGGGDHGINRTAALAQHLKADLGGLMMGGGKSNLRRSRMWLGGKNHKPTCAICRCVLLPSCTASARSARSIPCCPSNEPPAGAPSTVSTGKGTFGKPANPAGAVRPISWLR